MAKLSVTIMAHRSRQAEAEELQTRFDVSVPIVYDPNPVPSADPRQRWKTGSLAWETHDSDADYHMVIQDDALVCEDIVPGLEKALDQFSGSSKPAGLVSPYSGTGKPHQSHIKRAVYTARNKNHAWWSLRSLCWGVAIIAPVHTIEPMLRWGSAKMRQQVNYDARIGMYYRDIKKWRTWYTNPSLVDHRDEDSLVGHGVEAGGVTRKAHHFHDGSALEIDWTRTPAATLQVRI